jgi:rhomboid family GlyGly-CTERM serine protease
VKFLSVIGPAARFALSRSIAPISIAMLCVLLATGGDRLRDLARYDRAALAAGEIWRLVGAHLLHLNWPHMWMNVIALLLLTALFEDVLETRDWLMGAAIAGLAIDAGLYWFAPEVGWYVGLSGVLHGLLALGGIRLALARAPTGYLLLLGLMVKLLWEQLYGPVPLSVATANGPVIVDAHLYGALGGSLAALIPFVVRRAANARL